MPTLLRTKRNRQITKDLIYKTTKYLSKCYIHIINIKLFKKRTDIYITNVKKETVS